MGRMAVDVTSSSRSGDGRFGIVRMGVVAGRSSVGVRRGCPLGRLLTGDEFLGEGSFNS